MQNKPVVSFSLSGSPQLPPSVIRIEAGQGILAILAVFVLVAACILLLVWKPSALWNVKNIGLARLLCAFPPALLLAFFVGKNAFRPRDMLRHLEGREFDETTEAAKHLSQEMAGVIKLDGGRIGIEISPNVPISLSQETQGFFVIGAPGGGKTVAIKHMLNEAVKRGDKCVIFDPKGDFLEMLRAAKKPLYYFAPWHPMTNAIDFCADLKTEFDAQEFSNRIIPKPNSGDVNWALGAQQMLIGLIIALQKKGDWTLTDLANYINLPMSEMREILAANYPQGAAVIETDDKPSPSYMSMLRTSSAQINFLATAFKNVKKSSTVSLNDWATNDDPKRKIIIIGGSKEYASLMEICAKFTVSTIANKLGGLQDSRERKIWFFLDEYPQIGRLDDIKRLVEFGRSKGIRVVVGTQDIAQVESLYSREDAIALQAMLSTKIICSVSGGITADALSKSLGTRTVERPNTSINYNAQGRSSSTSWQREILPVVPASVLTSGLGKDNTGIYAVVDIRNAQTIYKIKWPFINYGKEAEATKIAEQIDPKKAAEFAAIAARIEAEKAEFLRVKSAQSQTQPKGEIVETVGTDSQAETTQHEGKAEEADTLKEITASVALEAIAGGEVAHVVDAVSVMVESFRTPLNHNETHATYRTKKTAIDRLSDLEGEL